MILSVGMFVAYLGEVTRSLRVGNIMRLPWFVAFMFLGPTLTIHAQENGSRDTAKTNDSSHSLEVQLLETQGVLYRYRTGTQNFSVGVTLIDRAKRPGALVGYQTHSYSLPIEAILYNESASYDGIGYAGGSKINITREACYVGLGVWFKPIIYRSFYMPISFGATYPISGYSRIDSTSGRPYSNHGTKGLEFYMRLGGGFEF